MKDAWKSWFLTQRFFVVVFASAVPAVASVWVDVLYPLVLGVLVLAGIAVLADVIWLWHAGHLVRAERRMDNRLSNGEHNHVYIRLTSTFARRVRVVVVDELPVQFQRRDFSIKANIEAMGTRDVEYTVRPVKRGVYAFGSVHVFLQGLFGFVERRYSWEANREVAVYPSVMELKRAELHAFSNSLVRSGFRKQRRIGHTMEFEKIKEYVSGDDVRSMNWKATARSGSLMVNQFQDERSQDVVAVLDAGRVMKSPFEGMTSLDYAVNAALAFSNIVLRKNDRAGVITYGSRTSTAVAPSSKPQQLGIINEALYALTTEYEESDDERLVLQTRNVLKQRSLIMLYTNIDALSTLQRRLPMFSIIAKRHVLAVVIFDNKEVRRLSVSPVTTTEDVYAQMVARDYVQQKRDIALELRRHGIYCVIAPPESLSVASIDQYLELKSRGVI